MANETRGILDHQHIVPILDRVRLLASLNQFRVRLEDTKNLVFIRHRFAQQHTPPSCPAYLLRQLQIMQHIPLLAADHGAEHVSALDLDLKGHGREQVPGTRQQVRGQRQ